MDTVKERNKALCEKMPYLIPRNLWTDKISEDYDYERIRGEHELPEGWQKLFMQMCKDIRQPLVDYGRLEGFRFTQIKEKYGSMRCYTYNTPSEVYDIIDKYEYISGYVCQKCGKPATVRTKGFIMNCCDQCLSTLNLRAFQSERIEFNPTLRIECYSQEHGEQVECIDCSEEWRRLWE